MADLAITQYRFRLVRRGWSRGTAGQRVVAAARERLPSAIAERLAEAWPEAAGDASEPVCIKLRVRLGELAQACESDEALAALVARLIPIEDSSEAPALARARSRARVAATEHAISAQELDRSTAAEPASVARVLLDWHARGALAAHLASFDEPALEAWHRALLASPLPHSASEPSTPPPLREVVARHRAATELSRADQLRRRMLAVIDAIANAAVAPSSRELASVLDELMPLPAAPPPTKSTRATPGAPRPVASARQAAHASARRDRSVSCVLPFLLLQPLRRLGYLDALSAAFAAAGRSDELPAFATALAYKVLAPPERGWRRDPRVVEDAAAFAGLDEPLPESALLALANDAEAWTSSLDAVLARAVLAGHDPERPLLVVAHDRDHLLVEPDGLFPIAWNEDIARVLAGCRAPIVVARAAADRLRDLVPSFRVVTDAPPLRGEAWKRSARGAWWTNGDVPAHAHRALEVVDDARALAEELVARRPACFARTTSLDLTLALAAGVALGAIADALWRDREPTSPLLVMQRFAGLSGVHRTRDDVATLSLALGARSRDLSRVRCLGRVHVPWRGELVVEGG